MKTAIIYAHPWDGSFNNSILKTVIKTLETKNEEFILIDLYEDGFNPVTSKVELSLYGKGGIVDPLVEHYATILDNAQDIIFVFPIWWYDAPAILRGFLDKALVKNRLWKDGDSGLIPIRSFNKTLVITTSGEPTEVLENEYGNTITNTMINGTLKSVGMKDAKWINCGNVHTISEDDRISFLHKVSENVYK